MNCYEFKFNFFPNKKDGFVNSDILFPKSVDKIEPEQARIAQIIAAYALHLAGMMSKSTGGDYDEGIEQSVRDVKKFFSDAEFDVIF